MSTTIAIYLFDGAEELDWAGPWEVLTAWAAASPDDEVDVFTVADTESPVVCAKGLRVLADHTRSSAPAFDVLVYPGGRGTRGHLGDSERLSWVRALAADGVLMTSVCTGSLVYAAAGLLDEGPATTHWGSLDHLGSLGSGIEVRPDDRFVDRGEVITAAGVSAGIDMALHLIVRRSSRDMAAHVKRYIQYDPQPPV
jgi:transcriptional regulator GlxA family with amidase domain